MQYSGHGFEEFPFHFIREFRLERERDIESDCFSCNELDPRFADLLPDLISKTKNFFLFDFYVTKSVL